MWNHFASAIPFIVYRKQKDWSLLLTGTRTAAEIYHRPGLRTDIDSFRSHGNGGTEDEWGTLGFIPFMASRKNKSPSRQGYMLGRCVIESDLNPLWWEYIYLSFGQGTLRKDETTRRETTKSLPIMSLVFWLFELSLQILKIGPSEPS